MVGRGGCLGWYLGRRCDGRMHARRGQVDALAEVRSRRVRKGPADMKSAGPFRDELYSGLSSSPSVDLSNGFAG